MLNRGDLREWHFFADTDVLDSLREYFQVADQVCQRLVRANDDVQQAEGGKEAVASRGVSIAEDDVAGLLAAQGGAGFQHLLQNVFIANISAEHADAGVLKRDLETHI